jgi:hypothetical protein
MERVAKVQLKHYGPCLVMRGTYEATGNAAYFIQDVGGSPIATVSVNMPDHGWLLEDDEFFAKTWSENEQVAEQLLAQGVFEDTGKRVPSGFVQVHVWKEKRGEKRGGERAQAA